MCLRYIYYTSEKRKKIQRQNRQKHFRVCFACWRFFGKTICRKKSFGTFPLMHTPNAYIYIYIYIRNNPYQRNLFILLSTCRRRYMKVFPIKKSGGPRKNMILLKVSYFPIKATISWFMFSIITGSLPKVHENISGHPPIKDISLSRGVLSITESYQNPEVHEII